MSVIRGNENARQWETVPGSRVPVVVCTARAICISTAKFDYVDDDEVGDIKCFPPPPVLIFIKTEGRGGKVYTHTYQLRYASFILISNLFRKFFPTIFSRSRSKNSTTRKKKSKRGSGKVRNSSTIS